LVMAVDAVPGPHVHIVQPPSGASFFEGDAVTLQATASDSLGGDLSNVVRWSSSLDGPLGTGNTLVTHLRQGRHTISATVSDSGHADDIDSVEVEVDPRPGSNTAPLVVITAPLDGQTIITGQPATFTGSAYDLEDGPLTSGLVWTSDRDG